MMCETEPSSTLGFGYTCMCGIMVMLLFPGFVTLILDMCQHLNCGGILERLSKDCLTVGLCTACVSVEMLLLTAEEQNRGIYPPAEYMQLLFTVS